MRTYEAKFDFTGAKSQKRITKPSVVTGQMPKTILFFYGGCSQPAHRMIQHTRGKLTLSQTRREITSESQQDPRCNTVSCDKALKRTAGCSDKRHNDFQQIV